ncbi:HD domain-containing protein [Gluconacetobacter diazotrophicus]|uniref:HD domain-containing protein n=1 Tax=Gluconacetobacter diazotrophicus TaxID=33996 RepID=A0A7W4I8F6_GLUDI|nr:HD domain-containing phosphohydrolase [Gluconacetobacter diazotrophicus]MBB2158122.1 HD domain-containing protein [Gluconacetobacter diazotrophicus]
MDTAPLLAEAPRDLQAFSVSDLLRTLDAIDPGHGIRVARITVLLAGWADCRISVSNFMLAGKLHDVGKLLIPSVVRDAPRRLTPIEFAIIRQHPSLGLGIVRALGYPLPAEVYDAVWLHHERHDGSGYPLGLAGNDIPLIARIMAIADVIDAQLSSRSYKAAWPVARVHAYIRSGSGTQFDPIFARLAVENFEDLVRHRLP